MLGLVPFNRRNRDLAVSGFEEFYNLLDDFFTPRSLERGTFKLDVRETENEFIVEAELPGIQKDEISLNLEDGRLTISVDREESKEETHKNYLHQERRVSSMSRSIYLQDADSEKIKAKLDNGVLTVSVLKQEKQVNTRKIEIE